MTRTESPSARRTTSVSSTCTLASTTDMSAMVRSSAVSRLKVPGTATSPSSTLSRVTRPVIGATRRVLLSWSRASCSPARACSTWARAEFALACATSQEVRDCSTCSADTSVGLVRESSFIRSHMRFDWSRLACAWTKAAWEEATSASPRFTAASYCAGSIWTRKAPFSTQSPSLTPIRTMRPVMSALTSTLVFGSIVPLAVTVATRSRLATGSSRTSVSLPPRLAAVRAKMPPPTTTTRPMMRLHFARRDIDSTSQRRGRPTTASRATKARW